MRTAIFLVTALVAVSTATPWGSRANQQCASYCREASKFQYSVGTIYSYDYTGETASKIGGTSEQESRLHINAQADFEVVSQCELILRLKRVTLEQSDPQDVSARSVLAGSAHFASSLEQYPLIFSFQDGQVEHLCPSVDEPIWALNIKRGILSAMQNSMQDLAVSQLVFETDVVGHCETNYTVESLGRSGVTVSRSKDLLACTGRNGQHSSPVLSTPYSSASSIQSLPLLRSENECQQTIRNQLLEKSVCTESHLFRPFSNGQSGASTRVTQTLTYSSERRSDQVSTDYKRRKASLLFANPDSKKSSGSSLTIIENTLNHLSQESGISPQTPTLFARLVNALRSLSYFQLTELYSKSQQPTVKKYLKDAAPLIGTAASYGLMRDIIQDGHLSDIEVDMWLASLAFQPKPTIHMITAVSPMLGDNQVRPKALLSVSALIHAYCRNHPECRSEQVIRQAVILIEDRIGVACRGRDETEQNSILLALKALGNAGLIVSSSETLKKCYQEESNPIVIRLAAIDALRRVPCHIEDRNSLLSFYRDTKHDSELRIAAYLAVMQCPSAQLLEEVKMALTHENVNQVGSFVWTHLTNLQETSSPSKQAVRQLLASDFLRNKFNTDARKFSRNLEASTYWPDSNVGGSVESNVIFSSKSYLPRSANLNLTLDLFGESVNLLELGARLEGFESFVESFFGPGGLFPDDTIQKVLENLRGKRAAPFDKQSLNQLSTIFDVKGQLADQPQGVLYLRMFGNELHTQQFKGLDQLIAKPQSPIAMLLKAAGQKDIDFSKSASLLDVSYVLPTAIGLPLSLTVNATTTVSFKMGGTYQTASLTNVKVLGHVKPSGTVEVNGVMAVDAWTFGRSGVHVQNTMHTSTGLSGKLIIQGSQVVSVQLDTPEEATNTFSFDSRLFLFQENGPKAVKPDQRPQITKTACSPTWLSRTFGVELCAELEFWPKIKNGPSGPLTGSAHAALFLRKTDKHSSYRFDLKREGIRDISLVMDTPDSTVNRRISAQLTLDELANSLRASFFCPQKNIELAGKYDYTQVLKGADVKLSVDGAELASIRTALRTDLKGMSGRYEPSLIISQHGKEIVNFQGHFSFVATSKYGFDFQLKQLTVRPIRLTGDISRDNDNKHELSIGLKSYLLDATLTSTTRLSDRLSTSKTKIGYSLMEGTSQSFEFSGKYSRAVKGSLRKTTLAGIVQSSQLPQYLNGDLSWDLQQSENYVENNIRLNSGADQWELQQVYSGQPRELNVRLAVICKQQKVDWLIYTTFQNSDTTFSSQSGLRLSPGRQWSGKLDLVRQDYQPGRRYGGRVELSSPTSSRQLRAELSQEEEKQWDFVCEYSANDNIEASVMAVYKNLSAGIKCDHSVAIKVRSWVADELDIDSQFIASPTNSLFDLNGRYGDRKVSGSVEYNHQSEKEHSVNAKIIRNQEVPVFQAGLKVRTGDEKIVAVDILAGRRITFDFKLTPTVANIQFYWNKDVDLSQAFEFSGQLSATGGEAQLKCAASPPVRINVDKIGKDLKIQLEWRDSQAVVLRMELLPTRTAGLLTTPFDGYRQITFDTTHNCTKTAIDTQVTIDWQANRFTLSTSGGKTGHGNVSGAIKFTSTFALLENVGAEFLAISSQPLHRYSMSVQHQGRRAEISADYHRKEYMFSSASINLMTPIYGYESLKASIDHNQHVNNFQSVLKLEGPYSSRATVTLSGKNVKIETAGNLAITTTFSAVETFTTSFQLLNGNQEKKLLVTGWLNGQKIMAHASTSMSSGKLRSDFYLNTPFFEDVTAMLDHRFNGQLLQSYGYLSWASTKNVKINLDGQIVAGKTALNATLTTPSTFASTRLDQKKTSGKVETLFEAELDGKRVSWTLDAQNLQMGNVRLESKLTAPFQGFEDLRFQLERRRDGQKTITKMQLARQQNEITMEHDIEYIDLYNWANRLAVKTPFEGLTSLTVNAKQSWTDKLQHDGQLLLNGKSVTVALKADHSLAGVLTASGSFATSWSEDVAFDLKHADDGIEFHPVLSIRTGNGEPIRLETAYRRGPKNPSLFVEVLSPLADPLKINAAYRNASPVKTVKIAVNWNRDKNIDLNLDWALATFQSTIKTRLLTPFARYSNVEADIIYDLTGQRKTATVLLRRRDQTILLDAFAAGQGSTYTAEMVLSSPFYETVKASAVLDLAGARASIKLDRGKQQIHLHGVLNVAATQTAVTATLETPFSIVRMVKVEAVLKSNQELQLDIDFDQQKVTVTGFYSSGPSKGSLRGSLKTPFAILRSTSFDAVYDASGTTKTATLTLSKNHNVIQASAQLNLIGPAKLALTVRAPCCGIRHLDVTGSYEESTERKSGHLKMDLNGEKYQLDGHLIRTDGTAEVALKSMTGYQGYEQVVINAKFDVRQPTKTGSLTFSKNEDRFHFSGTATARSLIVDLTTPIAPIRSVRLEGRYGSETGTLTLIHNEETIKLTAGGSLTSLQGKLDCGLETTYSGYESLKVELVYDFLSTRKFFVLDAEDFRAEMEWNGRRLILRSNTPLVGYEKLELTADYALDNRELLAAVFFVRNGEKMEVRLNGLYDPANNEASFELQSPVPFMRILSSKLKWDTSRTATKSFNVQAARNDLTMELEMGGRFLLDNSALTLAARSNIEGWNSASLSLAYDVRSSISASLNIERNGVQQSFAGEAQFDGESAALAFQTPFEGMRTLGLAGKLIDSSRVNVSTDRTASLHLEREGVTQDYGLSLSFDSNSAAFSLQTPFANYEKMSAELHFELEKPQKVFNLIVTKNQHQIELNGQAAVGQIELKLATTLVDFENAMAAVRYDLKSPGKTLDLKLRLNEKMIQCNGSLEGLKFKIDMATPFIGFEHFNLNGDVQLTEKTCNLTLKHNGKHYELNGALTDRRLIATIKTPLKGFEVTDLSGRWNNRQMEFGFNSSAVGKVILSSEYELGTSIQFGRIVLAHNGFRYHNQLVANMADPWKGGEVNLNVQLPLDGLRNVTSSLNYNLVPTEKSLTLTLDNAIQHYETTARVSMTSQVGLAVVHIQTPLASWEEIDFSAGYDLNKKTASLVSERNGQSVVFVQALATLSPMSSILSGAVRVPALLSEDIEMMVAYNLAANSADAKIKFCSHEILFDGQRSDNWTSALATISTTFQHLEMAQINWNAMKKTAYLHFNNLKATLDGRMTSLLEAGLKATLSAPFLGTHTTEIEWNKQSNSFTSRAEYKNGQNRRFGTSASINFSVEKGDYKLTVHTSQAGIEDVHLIGNWATGDKINSNAALHWAGIKKFESIFDGQFSMLKSVARLQLVSPYINPITTQVRYDLESTEKSFRMEYNSNVKLNAIGSISSLINWNGKVDLVNYSEEFSVAGKCSMTPGSPTNEFSIRFEGKNLPASQLKITMKQRNEETTIDVSVQSPSLLENELVFQGDYDTTTGLSCSGTFSWAKDKNIRAVFLMNPAELTAELMTPFSGLETTRLSVKYDLGQPKQTLDTTFEWAGRTITGSANWQFEDGIVFFVRFVTPFKGFEDVGLRGTFLSGSDYTTTLSYSRAGKNVDIQGKLTTNTAGSLAKITFAGENELLSAVVEYDVRQPKKTASLVLSRGNNQRISVTAAGEFTSKLNAILTIETSSSQPIRLSLDMDPAAVEKNGRLTLEYGQQQKFELVGGWATSKTGSKFRLAAQTPFDGFKKILVNSRINQKAFDMSFEYGRNRKIQLNTQYRWDSKLSVYSVNGTLSTPWLEQTLSGQTYLSLNNGFHGSISLSPAAQKTYGIISTYRPSVSFEAAVQTPCETLRSAKMTGAFETDSLRSSKRFSAGVEYNGRQASIEGRLAGLNGRSASIKGSWNNQVVAVDTFYQNDTPALKMSANITTPFKGFTNWAGRFERTKKGQQYDMTLKVVTPLTYLPSVDATLQTVLDARNRLDVVTSVSTLGHTGRARFQLAKDMKNYLASLELDVPFIEILRSVNIRAECQIDGWKKIASTVTAGVPAGDYTVKASVLVGKSSLNLNAEVKTPSYAKSIEMGAGYNADVNLDMVQGEVFIWDNKMEGRYEKRGNQIAVELSCNLPDLKLAHTRLNLESNYRSARQLQASVSFITLHKTHTLSLAYQLAGNKFTAQVDVDSPVFQSKKTLSLKLNYSSLAALTFEGRFVDGQNICELTGSLRLTGEAIYGQAKYTCPMFGTAAVEVMGSPAEGKLTITTGKTVHHRLGYKFNTANGGYDVTMDVQSPWIKPLHVRGILMLSQVQQGQVSLTVRYGESSHSVLGDYLRSGGDRTAASFSLSSPNLPGGQASIQGQYQPMDLKVQLDVLGQNHQLSGFLQHWPDLSGKIQLDSPFLPWKTMALQAQADRNVRDFMHGQANITASYGEQSLGLAGRFRFAQWSDFEGSMELNTPFEGLTMARADVQLSAINAQRVNASLNFQSSHALLPRASFNVQYQLGRAAFDASATLNTPFSSWETVALAVNIPLVSPSQDQAKPLIALTLPSTRYSFSGLLAVGRREFLCQLVVDYGGRKFTTDVVFKADEIYQAKIDVTTPIRGFETYSWDVKGQANVRRWGEATAFLDWNGKRIEFSSNIKVEPLAYIAIVQLNTPFVDFERYAVHLRLEGTDRKTLQLEVESPGMRVGADFDYVFNTVTDFVGKASIRTPLAGYESFTLQLSNQLGASSYSANAEARFADYGLAATMEGLIRQSGFQAQMDGRYNDRVIVLKASGSLDEKRVTCNLKLATPFEELSSLESFVQLEKDMAESKGFGLSLNGRQIMLVSLAKQSDGLQLLQIKNPWRPIDFSYSWENSADLIHYHAQFCWDLNRRSTATLGAQIVVKTSSYGRQINIKMVTPRREVSVDYALELTSTKVDHSIALSWATNKTVGYRVMAENSSSRRRTQLNGSIRLDLPVRSFQLESRHTGGESTSTHIDLKWDAARDPAKRVGGRLETRQGRHIRLMILHPELEHDIVLQGEYERVSEDQVTGKIELMYSPLEEHRFLMEGSMTQEESCRAIQLTILHPASHTDLRLVANGNQTVGTEMNTRIDYKDRSMNARFLQLAAKVLPEQRRIDLEARTAEKSLSLSNALTVSGSSYVLASRTLVNDINALTADVRLETSSLRPTLQIDGSYAGQNSFNVLAGMPDNREITLRAVRDIHGRQITDGLFQLKLNQTDLLSSRLYWRAASRVELRNAAVNGLVRFLSACESFTDDFANFVASEWADKHSSLTPTARFISQRLTKSMAGELDSICSEFKQIKVELVAMYQQNDFYLKNIISTLKQVASLAQPFLDRTMASIEAISQAVIGETAAFYRAAVNTYTSLAQIAYSGFQQLTSYVSSGVTEVARSYSQLAGEVMSRLFWLEATVNQSFQRVRSLFNEYAGRLEIVVMEQVEEIRRQLIEMATSYAESFRPYINYFDNWIERARLIYVDVLENIEDGRQFVQKYLMAYAPFQRLYKIYLEYASWLEEIHTQDYIEDCINYLKQVKQGIMERINMMTARYQPLIDPVVEAFRGQMEALKKLPVFVYLNTAVHRMYQQLDEFIKYIELEAQLRQILRDALHHTDKLTTQLIKDLTGSLSFPMKPTMIIDWESGRLEYSQKLPFTWENFGQLPRLRELPLLRKIASAKKNLIREMDYSQFYFSTMNALAIYRPMKIQSILPPFGSRAFVAGTQHYMTFDRRFYEFAGECSYLLTSDFFRNDFSAIVNYEGAGGKVIRKSLTVLSDNRQVEIDSSFRVTLNGRKIEMPFVYDNTNIQRDGQRLIVTNSRSGFRVDCNLYRDICSVHVSGWSFGKTGGLFGIYNNEPADDFMTPFRQQRTADEVDSFANSWKVGTSRCRVRNFAVTRPTPSERNTFLCDQLFVDEKSVLRPCFQMVDPAPFARMCLNDLTALENSPKKDLGVCTAASAYANECRFAGLDLFIPSQCVRCELEDGKVIGSGDIKTFQNDAPRSADVVFIVDQKPCLNGTRLSNLPAAIDAALRERGIQQNRFAVVGYGGRGGPLFQQPHIRTADGGQIWSNRKGIQLALEDLPLVDQQQAVPSDIHAALRYAVNLPYRVGVSKQFVLVSCGGSECQASSYADALTLLIENDVKLHLLQPRDIIVKGKNGSEELKNIFGFDAEEVYTVRNVRSLKGDRELRRQLILPKDFCTPLALETNGTLFDLKKMMPASAIGQQQQQTKKFIDIFSRRVAATGEPSPCQRCDCIGDRDGIGSILCQRCVSPVMERLDKVWEQLVYENEMESASNVEDVTVAQISDLLLDQLDMASRFTVSTTPLEKF